MEQLKRQLYDLLPRYYDESPEVDAIIGADAEELDKLRTKARDLLDQLFVATATWGLADWDRVLALPPAPNATTEFRRKRILAKLAGNAPATIQYLTDLVNVYVAKKEAKIIEHNADYSFEAEIPLEGSVVTADIYNAVNEIKPAHLAFSLTGVVKPERIDVSGSGRGYGIPYPITNMFITAMYTGKLLVAPITFTERVRIYEVKFPITNVMRTADSYVNTINSDVVMAGK